jgi:cytochrome oxidase Cu insertion factor (SCO1/SenC/PrrC family)
MAKFKRFDPQNKKAERRREYFANSKDFHKRNTKLTEVEPKGLQKYNAKTIHTFEEELEL